MKRYLSLFVFIIFSIVFFGKCENETDSKTSEVKELSFQFCPNYFISNKYEAGDHYLILNDDSTFTSIFHHYSFPPDTTAKIIESDFENYIVLGIIKPKNHFTYDRSVDKVTLINGNLKIYYTFTILDTLTSYERYGIVAKVEKRVFNKVEFYENDKLVNTSYK